MTTAETRTEPDRHSARATLARWTVAALPSWILGRAITVAALAVAHYLADQQITSKASALAATRAGLTGEDGAWYVHIASAGYGPVGSAGDRFFPLFPIGVRLVHLATALPVKLLAVAVPNLAMLAASALLVGLTERELSDRQDAVRAVWLFNLVPAAFVTVMAYSEPLFLLALIGCMFAMRTGRWWTAALCALALGALRPVGLAFGLPILIEALRGRPWSAGWRTWLPRLAALGAPAASTLAYLLYVGHLFGNWLGPYSFQVDPTHRGLSDPVTGIARSAADLLSGSHLGTGLHFPFLVVAVALTLLGLRRLPWSYSAWNVVVLATATTGTILNSFERYVFVAFPLVMVGATVTRSPRVLQGVLVLSAAGMFMYALLTFTGAYIP